MGGGGTVGSRLVRNRMGAGHHLSLIRAQPLSIVRHDPQSFQKSVTNSDCCQTQADLLHYRVGVRWESQVATWPKNKAE